MAPSLSLVVHVDTYAVDPRDLEVVYELHHHVLVGVCRVALPHLTEVKTRGVSDR